MKETVINAFADKAVLERLFTNGPGELLAANSKASYLKVGQDVYMLCSADLGITPIGIAVDDYAAAAAALRLSAGGRFDTADNALVFCGGVLRVQPYAAGTVGHFPHGEDRGGGKTAQHSWQDKRTCAACGCPPSGGGAGKRYSGKSFLRKGIRAACPAEGRACAQ